MTLRRVVLMVNEAKPAAVHAAEILRAWCVRAGVVIKRSIDADVGTADGTIVLALGGDGTVLRAAAWAAPVGIPVLGINVGSLGFLSAAPPESLIASLERVARGEIVIEERMRLAYSAGGLSGSALNELVVCGVGSSRFCELQLSSTKGGTAVYAGDGLIVCTPTGSTAYSLSAGGPIVLPDADSLVVTPHATHALGVRPVVFPPGATLEIAARGAVELIADGDVVGALDGTAGVIVRRSEVTTHLIRFADSPGFFAVLEDKLGWSGDPRRGRRL